MLTGASSDGGTFVRRPGCQFSKMVGGTAIKSRRLWRCVRYVLAAPERLVAGKRRILQLLFGPYQPRRSPAAYFSISMAVKCLRMKSSLD